MESTIDKEIDRGQISAAADSEAWLSVLELCGEQRREGAARAKPDDPVEKRVCSRSYTLKQASRLAGVNGATLRQAAAELALDSFLDPRGKLRFPVYSFKPTAADPDLREMIAGYERLQLEEICAVLGMTAHRLKRRLDEVGLSPKGLVWRDVRGLWNLPDTFMEFSEQLAGAKRRASAWQGQRASRRQSAAPAQARTPGNACAIA